MSSELLLPAKMRPRQLADFVGQTEVFTVLRNKVAKDGIPHVFLLVGDPGTGKTSLARILAGSIVDGAASTFGSPRATTLESIDSNTLDVTEYNAAVNNGVDFARELADRMAHVPMFNNNVKITILDEAHRLTSQAQDALLKSLEEPRAHAYWMLATDNAGKIDAALRRRCYIINMGTPRPSDLRTLIGRALDTVAGDRGLGDVDELLEALDQVGISAPGIVLQIAERWLHGMPPLQAVTLGVGGKLDYLGVARAVAQGSWAGVRPLLADGTKEDAMALRITATSYLKAIMLNPKSNADKCVRCARAIGVLAGVNNYADVIDFNATLAALCGACKLMGE